ncbi:NAD-dependent epimerase/dehydratase family protein [Mesobacillus subterraneus]|uniref:NAD-dependent epimerase/dehydratase family protein n=1 Tax=Mesobacillus subterraneus TaxID=285983 RepID=UPI001CFDFF84|nr:NAD-dependent epimerase/dehydratase family protein [Mesobacillus subterraneus]WLR54787.1 NAD-dependent epimerase/dehydratase family protein [Mesobacillus subterraneus]
MKVLVVGGAGFIGSHVVDALVKKGYEIVVVDNLSSGKKDFLHPGAAFYSLNILDEGFVTIFEKERPDAVFHLAAQINVQKSIENSRLDAEVNILGTLKILELCKKHDCKLIYSSSAAVYGNPVYLPVDERHPVKPLSNYGISKYTPEMYISLYSQQYDVDYTILRYANVYGPRQDAEGEGGVVSIFMKKMINNEPPIIFGNGEQTRDFIYVEDVAAANIAAMEKDCRGVFNISSNQEMTINSLVDEINSSLKTKLAPIHKKFRAGDILHSCLNNLLAQNKLGWEPRFSFKEGLKKTVDSYRQ